MNRFIGVLLVSILSTSVGFGAGKPAPEAVKKALTEAFDVRGKEAAPPRLKDPAAHVVFFMGSSCPLATKYLPRLIAHQAEYQKLASEAVEEKPGARRKKNRAANIQYYFVYSNLNEELATVVKIAKGSQTNNVEIPLPVIFDATAGKQKIADLLGAEKLSQTFVFDGNYELVYRGAYDDQYSQVKGQTAVRAKVNEDYARNTIFDVLGGHTFYTQAPTYGCDLEREKPVHDMSLTYNKDIAPIMRAKCEMCHSKGGAMEDYPLTTYKQVKGALKTVSRVVGQRVMPPWGAHPAYGEWANDISLKDEEIEKVVRWAENGGPEGDTPAPPVRVGPSDSNAFTMGEPDWVFSLPEQTIKAANVQPYVNYMFFDIDKEFTEDLWVQWSEIIPSNPKVVHHVVVYVRPPFATYYREPSSILKGVSEGQAFEDFAMMLSKYKYNVDKEGLKKSEEIYGLDGFKKFAYIGVFVPGWRTMQYPKDSSFLVQKGSKIRVEVHYTPGAKEEKDIVKVGVKWRKKGDVAKHELETMSFGKIASLRIPANVENHIVEQRFEFPRKAQLVIFRPHAHLRGRSFVYSILRPGETEWQTLLYVPRYDFKNQPYFEFKKPVVIEKGTVLKMTVTYNNTITNRNLTAEQADEEVFFGQQTNEEMCFGYVNFAWLEKASE